MRKTNRGFVFILGLVLAVNTAMSQSNTLSLAGDALPTSQGDLILHPIQHATLALAWNHRVVYVDPVGDARRFEGLPGPDLIVLTDIHGDHLNLETLKVLVRTNTHIIAPPAVAEKLPGEWKPSLTVLTNTQKATIDEIQFEAVPMYNLTPSRSQYHTPGRGNGYVLTMGGKRVYLSGDTEDIAEMRALKDIDVAFVCMNLPYTMTVEQAASAVKAFKPKRVYPYHYRGSDVEKFKLLVSDDPSITVCLKDWYRP